MSSTAAVGEPQTRTPSESVLRAEVVTSGYGDRPAIRDIGIDLRSGEVVSVMGPNGAGKTTLVLTLAGELPLLSGSVTWLGRRNRAPLHRRARQGLAFVPEGRSVVSGLSAADNLRLGRGGIGPAVDLFPELRPLLGRTAGLLSGGEQQMLAMGRALASSPKALLVDELSLGLAPAVTARLMAAVRRAASESGVAVLLVEQQIARAFDVCDRWIVLKRGRVVADGTRSDTMQDIERAYFEDE
jgi:branched-chain amino acid transport system ATP-binding protein